VKRRKSRRTSQRKPQRQPRPSTPAPDAARDADPLADSGLRPLLESYCRLAGVKQAALASDLTALSLPQAERPFFRDRASLRVAFSLDALERDPDADIAVLGSPFLSQLIGAIRARAAHLSLGLIAPTLPAPSDPTDVELTIPVRDGTAQLGATRSAVHPVGRLSARVVLRAGAGVEEAVVESDVYDLSAGVRLSDDLVAAFRDLEAGRVAPADPSVAAAAARIPARQPTELLELLLAHLRDKSAERVAARRALAEQELAAELGRLDRYFESILKEQTDPEAVGTVTALAERRRTEEIRRSQVKAVVHPLQLIEADVLIQRAEWRLESAPSRRHHATFSAQRPLGSAGAAPWSMACPQCGRPPALLVICRHDHCACEACSHRCSVCAEDFCADHGIAQCRVDAQAACDEHVRVCPSCRLEHCTAHQGLCTEGDGHPACSACLAPCGNCGRVVCNRHAEQSHAAAPKGSRRLCAACLKYCEGGQAHCAPHLRRTDKSQRLVCARHRAGCAHEPGALFAVDEVGTCPICARGACQSHRAACEHCGRRVCTADLSVESRRCATCAQLAAVSDLPHAVVAAVLAATGSGPKPSRRWRMARDRSHLVVELDLGWRQTAVVTLRQGDNVPDGVVKHSPLRLKRRK